MSLTSADNFGHFEYSVNFWQLFRFDVFWVVFDFCLCVKDNVKLLGSIPNVDCGMW